MINVNVKYDATQIKEIHVFGHALSNVSGKDLVCAGVSAVVIGALNSLEHSKHFKISIKEGDVKLTAVKPATSHDVVVLNVLLTSLKTIEETYSKYLKITEER